VDKIGNEYSDGIWKVCCRRSPFSTPLDDTQTHQWPGLTASCKLWPRRRPPRHTPRTRLFFFYIYFFFSGSDISGQGWQLVASCGPGEAPPAHAFLYIYIYLFFWERHKWPGLTASCRLWPREGPPAHASFLFFICFYNHYRLVLIFFLMYCGVFESVDIIVFKMIFLKKLFWYQHIKMIY